jgi:HlyD family secretion protein
MRKVIGLLFLLTSVGPALGDGDAKGKFRTEAVRRGDLTVTVQATGTVEPEEVVNVGAKVSGQIIRFGVDPQEKNKSIDFGTRVEEGTVLAQIDPVLYEIKVEQAREELQKRRASLQLLETRLRFAERQWQRAQKLEAAKVKPHEETEELQSQYEIIKSELDVGKADLRLAQAVLREADTKLGYATIKSPTKGVIIDRRVNIGQAVGPAPNSPSLFLIAKDLNHVQVWATVREGDIAKIHPGQAVRFAVDAYPNEVFAGKVVQVRLNAAMSQNVVTYTVEVNSDNPTGKLLPYLTANLQFDVDKRKSALLVPNAALRWRPPQSQPAAELGTSNAWIEDKGSVRPVKLHLGLTDGAWTEILAGDLAEGQPVITGDR